MKLDFQIIYEKLKCHLPFGSYDKNQICQDEREQAKAILKMATNQDLCIFPCRHLGNLAISSSRAQEGFYFFYFKRHLQKYESKYTYGLVDLFAALGGYLGSFLGVSLFHLRDGFAYLIRKAIY